MRYSPSVRTPRAPLAEEWRLGKPDFAIQQNKPSTQTLTIIDEYRSQGHIVSVLASEEGVAAVFGFDDPLRAGVVDMLEGLNRWGVNTFVVLSGDAEGSVIKLCNQLGIKQCLGDQKPVDKLTWTRDQQGKGHSIAMFGDGINDAPTLATADVSISFAGATDLANVSSDFLILGDSADVLADARRLSQLTQRIIKQNFMWAAGYNLLAVPFAAAGYIPPWGAATSAEASEIEDGSLHGSVILNSLTVFLVPIGVFLLIRGAWRTRRRNYHVEKE